MALERKKLDLLRGEEKIIVVNFQIFANTKKIIFYQNLVFKKNCSESIYALD